MKPEEFEVYVIPPNFMEGGTLFGGLLKTRNTIEAVILGLAVGVPVLHLPFSLTVRVVILCLTALPLVLLALIGVSGMSLSAFIRLFFCFLHNRRILSRDGTQGGKNGKTLLPSWAQQRKSDCEAEGPPLPKSRSRFSVDLKQRSVTQFKTFLQEEEAVQPLNALADYIPIEKIEHGVIYTRDHRYYDIAAIGYLHAVQRYFTEKSLHRYRFSTIAWRSMNSSLNTFRRQEQRRKSHEFSYQAAHPPPDDAFDALRARLLLHDLFLLADKEQALLIHHRLHGCSLAETARREGMSVKRVRHRLKALYRAYFAQEETKQKEL